MEELMGTVSPTVPEMKMDIFSYKKKEHRSVVPPQSLKTGHAYGLQFQIVLLWF